MPRSVDRHRLPSGIPATYLEDEGAETWNGPEKETEATIIHRLITRGLTVRGRDKKRD